MDCFISNLTKIKLIKASYKIVTFNISNIFFIIKDYLLKIKKNLNKIMFRHQIDFIILKQIWKNEQSMS